MKPPGERVRQKRERNWSSRGEKPHQVSVQNRTWFPQPTLNLIPCSALVTKAQIARHISKALRGARLMSLPRFQILYFSIKRSFQGLSSSAPSHHNHLERKAWLISLIGRTPGPPTSTGRQTLLLAHEMILFLFCLTTPKKFSHYLLKGNDNLLRTLESG